MNTDQLYVKHLLHFSEKVVDTVHGIDKLTFKEELKSAALAAIMTRKLTDLFYGQIRR